jgi:hypothetical protein
MKTPRELALEALDRAYGDQIANLFRVFAAVPVDDAGNSLDRFGQGVARITSCYFAARKVAGSISDEDIT